MNARPSVLPKANQRCWCGSAQKYKSCHREADRKTAAAPPSTLETKRREWQRAAMEEMAAGRPGDFDLAPLTSFEPGILLPLPADTVETVQLKRLTLTLALIFNDLKDLLWAGLQLQHFSLDLKPGEVTATTGQLVGMRNFFTRHANGVVAELGLVLHSKKDLIASARFRAAMARIDGPNAVRAWDALIGAFTLVPAPDGAKKKAPASKVAQFFNYVRNKAAYHYGNLPNEDEVLARGYAAKFARPKPGDASAERAFLSMGNSMTASRFYFADAAIDAVISEAVALYGVTPQESQDFVGDINLALRFIVGALVVHFKEAAEKVPAP